MSYINISKATEKNPLFALFQIAPSIYIYTPIYAQTRSRRRDFAAN